MRNEEIVCAGRNLFVQLEAEGDRTKRRRFAGEALAAVGLGLTLTTNLREMILVAYDKHEADRELFVNEWRRLVLHEKGKWYQFRLGVRPVQLGVN